LPGGDRSQTDQQRDRRDEPGQAAGAGAGVGGRTLRKDPARDIIRVVDRIFEPRSGSARSTAASVSEIVSPSNGRTPLSIS